MKNLDHVKVQVVDTPNILLKSKQDGFDFVANPYTGCPYACKYCYASFMRRFSKHKEPWGEFVDVKKWENPINKNKIEGKRILISSVTDPYNPFEEKYKVVRKLLKELSDADCEVVIQTKSDLILRDIDILKKMKNVTVAISLCSLNEKVAQDLEAGLSVASRLNTLKKLHKNNIKTTLAISPLMPELTDWKAIIEQTKNFVDEYTFEALTLRNEFKPAIINYVWQNFHDVYPEYLVLYKGEPENYWGDLAQEIGDYCKQNQVKYSKIVFPYTATDTAKINLWK